MNETPSDGPSAGALLKAAREKQGLHIAALAAAIKVSPRKLEALEADRLHELPDATFVRALAQTVCRTLKVEPKPVLDKLPAAGPQALLPSDAGINTPFRDSPARRSSARSDDSGWLAWLSRPMFVAAALLVLAAAALWLVPADLWKREAPPLAVAPAPLPAPAQPMPLPTAASAPMADAALGAASQASAAAAVADAASAVVAPLPAPPAVAPTPAAVPPATPAPAPVAQAPASALQLSVSKASWVEVRDARGVALLSRTVSPGEQLGLDGRRPLAVVIGNVAATELVFLGQRVDLQARSRDNVARFTLN